MYGSHVLVLSYFYVVCPFRVLSVCYSVWVTPVTLSIKVGLSPRADSRAAPSSQPTLNVVALKRFLPAAIARCCSRRSPSVRPNFSPRDI